MLLVGPVRDAQIEGEGLERLAGIASAIPAVTHVDGSARVQTVTRERNGIYYDLLKAFERRTGCPVLVNTSFNVRGEPIVGTAADAVRVFRRTHMDALVIGRHVVTKAAMPAAEREAFTPERDRGRIRPGLSLWRGPHRPEYLGREHSSGSPEAAGRYAIRV